MGERRLCTAEVRGSNPLGSTPKSCNLQEKRKEKGGLRKRCGDFVQQPCNNAAALEGVMDLNRLHRWPDGGEGKRT